MRRMTRVGAALMRDCLLRLRSTSVQLYVMESAMQCSVCHVARKSAKSVAACSVVPHAGVSNAAEMFSII